MPKKQSQAADQEQKIIEQIPLAELIPYARNARTHSAAQISQLAGSLREFGWVNPVLIDADNGIIAGHGRVMAAQQLGMMTAPCLRISHLSDAQRRAYILADNQLALNSDWNDELLKIELADLQLAEFDIGLIGFSEEQLAAFDPNTASDADAEPQIDKAEELRAKWGVEPGQLWELGDHRLLCGDSTKKEDVERVMGGERADLCFTSPPYGQQRDYTKESKGKLGDWDGLMRGVFANLPMATSGQVLVNLGMIHRDGEWIPYWDGWISWMCEQGWRRFGWYVWDQGPGMPGDWNGRLAPSHEFIWHFNKESVRAEKGRDCKHAGQIYGGKGQRGADGKVKQRSAGNAPVQNRAIHDSVFRVNRQGAMHGASGHPAPYPVGLPLVALQSWDGIAYEPFSGSGTTIIACEQLGRKCRAIEISPAYVAVALQRWADATGKTPTLVKA